MKHAHHINRTILVAFLMCVLMILPGISIADDLVRGTMVMSEFQERDLEEIAVESVLDTLKACMKRIPSDATVGQQMLAEQNCQQVDVQRNRTHLSF